MKHQPVDTGEDCCVAHFDAAGNSAPSCVRCAVCRRWCRPEGGDGECPGPPSGPPQIVTSRYPPEPEPDAVVEANP